MWQPHLEDLAIMHSRVVLVSTKGSCQSGLVICGAIVGTVTSAPPTMMKLYIIIQESENVRRRSPGEGG